MTMGKMAKDKVQITARVRQEDVDMIERWRGMQRKIPPLSQALVTLAKMGIAADTKREGAAK